VQYLGPKQNEELVHFIRQHHLFILPTIGENFGHSIFEALLSGRPVLISDQTPWLKLDKKKAGWDIPLTEPDRFGRIIKEFAEFDQTEFDKWAIGAWTYAQSFITNPEIHKKYLELFS
jgi:glycosyltransferase involved in cell wall biosynthesis